MIKKQHKSLLHFLKVRASVCLSSFILRTTFRLQIERTSKKEDPGNEVGRETGFVISFFLNILSGGENETPRPFLLQTVVNCLTM